MATREGCNGNAPHEAMTSRKVKIVITGIIGIIVLFFIVVCFIFLIAGFVIQAYALVWLCLGVVIYLLIVSLYMYTSSTLKAKLLSAAFLSVLAMAVLALGLTIKRCNCFAYLVPQFFVVFAGDAIAFIIFSLSALGRQVWYWRRAYKRRGTFPQQQIEVQREYDKLHLPGLPTKFSYGELQDVTGGFRTIVGRGSSGAVFKGTLRDGTSVAVKRTIVSPIGDDDCPTEITIIASLRHFNLVRLLGYCLLPGGDCYHIYPFFENGSLDSWLFAADEKRSRLGWVFRYQIAIDIATALVYLHHECDQQILHLDIKPANVLLDDNFRAHVSDFGISKSIGRDATSVLTRGRGTLGYMPPEVLAASLSAKSDVYSYGITLLELVGSRRVVQSVEDDNDETSYLPRMAGEKVVQGKVMELVDGSLAECKIKQEEVKVMVQVTLRCIQESRELRPDMPKVVEMLQARTPVSLPPYALNILDEC